MDLVDRVIAREGGAKVTNDPADPGGLTKYGISSRRFPTIDIRALTYEQARALYIEHFLAQPGFTKIKDEYLQELVFDYGVHSGPEVAIKALQKLLGVTQDGVLGPTTIETLDATNLTFRFYIAYMRERLLFLARLVMRKPSSLKYLAGWISRVLSV